ncbi:hypothetical protein C8Q74DRAFT_1260718 [Fomes fomentarius]|nr:hypothetical protein C8Q74DRAFT_1260718 [Fomes fomentarius]
MFIARLSACGLTYVLLSSASCIYATNHASGRTHCISTATLQLRMLVPSFFITCLLALMGVLRGLSTDSMQSWLSQPTLSSRLNSLGMISPPDHLTLATDPSTTTSLTPDSWTPAPLINGTLTGAQPARASDLPFYRVLRGVDLPMRLSDSRHRGTRVAFVVMMCLGLSAGGASVTVLLMNKTTDVVTRTPSASDRSCLDRNIDRQAVCTLPRRSARRHPEKAKLRHNTSSCPHALWNPDISVAADKLRCDTGFTSTYLPQPTLRTTKPIPDPRSSGHTTRKVFAISVTRSDSSTGATYRHKPVTGPHLTTPTVPCPTPTSQGVIMNALPDGTSLTSNSVHGSSQGHFTPTDRSRTGIQHRSREKADEHPAWYTS